ncbi:29152_t:CDS:2, partial [Gigaspora margarita]
NSIKSEVSGITLLCSLSSKNANSSKTVEQPSKQQRTDPIWTIIEETNNKNYFSNNPSRLYFKKHLKCTLTTENSEHKHDIFDEYLSSAKEDCNVLEFWKIWSNDLCYATLTQMAQDYLVVQATSVASKQIFLVAKYTISPTRNQLSPENVYI